jgi:hypothetical protein
MPLLDAKPAQDDVHVIHKVKIVDFNVGKGYLK